MVLDLDNIEEIVGTKRQRVRHGWGPSCEYAFSNPFWNEWVASCTMSSEPIQIQLITPKFVVDRKKLVEKLTSKLDELVSSFATNTDRLYEKYISNVSIVEIVQEVVVVETEETATIWTIIKSPPFADSLRKPIYDAQLQILRMLGEDTTLDFYVLNVSELPQDEKPSNVIPSNAKVLWQR